MGAKITAAEKNRRKRERKKQLATTTTAQPVVVGTTTNDSAIATKKSGSGSSAAAAAVVVEVDSYDDRSLVVVLQQSTTARNQQQQQQQSLSEGAIEIEYIEPELSEMIPTANTTTNHDHSITTSNNSSSNNNSSNNNSSNSSTSQPPQAPPLNDAIEAVRRFRARIASMLQSDDNDPSSTKKNNDSDDADTNDDDDDDDANEGVNGTYQSKRKLREVTRPTISQLKRQVRRPDLVEAHDITATDPVFLLQLKSIPHTVPVPRHWGRKRKYLQGKRIGGNGPLQQYNNSNSNSSAGNNNNNNNQNAYYTLPQFLINTGITELRDSVMDNEKELSAKQKNRARVQVKLGAIDVDYRTLHDAFFKHQTKPMNMTSFGQVYYEGKEYELRNSSRQIGEPLSQPLRMALGMSSSNVPPPWLLHMQRYGPPPSYPHLKIPGLNAPLPDPTCQYGYHPTGWGKPPIDIYARPLYGGNPFDPPGSSNRNSTRTNDDLLGDLVTSDGKTIAKNSSWGALPTGMVQHADEDEESSEEDDDDDEDMEESSEEEQGETTTLGDGEEDGIESTLPPPAIPSNTAPVDLRKSGLDTPMSIMTAPAAPPKQLYRVIEQKQTTIDPTAVFASETVYTIPTAGTPSSSTITDGAESVLSKAVTTNNSKQQQKQQQSNGNKGDDDDDDDENIKNFKF